LIIVGGAADEPGVLIGGYSVSEVSLGEAAEGWAKAFGWVYADGIITAAAMVLDGGAADTAADAFYVG